MGINIGNAALRLSTGAFILNSGLGKLHLPKEAAEGLQSMAGNAFPQLKELDPERFGKLLSYGEIALGSALLLPFIPTRLAGLGLGAFAAGQLATYSKTPGMTLDDGIRPTQAGTALAKDVWMAGIAVALVLHRKSRGMKRKASKAGKAAAAASVLKTAKAAKAAKAGK
jgi:hypothetical protein